MTTEMKLNTALLLFDLVALSLLGLLAMGYILI